MSDPELWAFPVTVISRGEVVTSDVLALRALIEGSAHEGAIVSVDRQFGLSLESLMPPPPPPPAKVAEYHLISAATNPRDVLDWLSVVGNDGAPESVGIEVVGFDWRDRALVSRMADRGGGQVNLGVRVKPAEPDCAIRGLLWSEFIAVFRRHDRGDLIERLRAVILEGHRGSKDYELERVRSYTRVRPPEDYIPEPNEENVVTYRITYGRTQFLRDVVAGTTHWFLQGAGGKLAVMKAEEGERMMFIATRAAASKDFLFIQIPVGVLTDTARTWKAPVYKLLLEFTRRGFTMNVEDVMNRTGLLFA